MFKLLAEDMTNAGLAMGFAHTKRKYKKYFHKIKNAKAFAEKEYGKPINWISMGRNTWTSGDLGHVAYNILPEIIKFED